MDLFLVPLLLLIFSFLNRHGSQGSEVFLTSAQNQNMASTSCNTDAECDHLPNANCFESFCRCNGSRFCVGHVETTKVTKLGEICKTDPDCIMEHAVCVQGTCRCEEGRVGSENGRKCLKVANGLGSTCEDSIQCYTKVPQSGCQNEKCVCQQKTHEYQGTCFGDVGLGQKCIHLGDCTITQFARCIDEKCACKDGYVSNDASSKCLEVAKRIDDPCYENVQCSAKFGKAICQQGFCKCGELYQYKLSKELCVLDLLLDEICENHTDCHGIEPGESRLECILGQCKCKSGYVEERGFCISGASYLIHSPSLVLALVAISCLHFNDNLYVLWCSLLYSFFYIFWITFLRSCFINNLKTTKPKE